MYVSLRARSVKPVSSALQPIPQTPSEPTPQSVPEVNFGEFPSTLQELIGNRQLNRLLGLSNLYYIDPTIKVA